MGFKSSEDWFLVQFKPNCHRIAESNLKRQGFKTFLPLQEQTKRKKSKFVNYVSPLFPGYMFVSFKIQIPEWHKIKGTVGISRLLYSGEKPTPLPTSLIHNLMSRCDKSSIIRPVHDLSLGEKVKLLVGPFANFVAKVEKIDSQRRVWLLLDFMEKTTRVHINTDHIIQV